MRRGGAHHAAGRCSSCGGAALIMRRGGAHHAAGRRSSCGGAALIMLTTPRTLQNYEPHPSPFGTLLYTRIKANTNPPRFPRNTSSFHFMSETRKEQILAHMTTRTTAAGKAAHHSINK